MKNLAGDQKCDITILEELRRSKIEAVPYNPPDCKLGEVPSRLKGKLGPFVFWRAWYYWVVSGPMPIHIAKKLYEDPVGVTDVRVAGHCACPPPEYPWYDWYTKEGKKVVPVAQQAEWEKFKDREWMAPYREKYIFHDNPEELGAMCYVNTYHIDSEVGLRLFCDMVREHELDQKTREDFPWWKDD